MILFYYNHLIGMRKKNVGTIELPKEIIIPQLINATNIRNVSKKKDQ